MFIFQIFQIQIELMVLFSAFAAVFGMFILNRLPQHYHPLFNNPRFSTATSHGFFVAIEAQDPKFDKSKVELLLKNSGATHIEVIEED